MVMRHDPALVAIFFLAGFVLLAGCTALNIGDIGYSDGNFVLSITNDGKPSGAFLQLKVFRLSGYSQEELMVINHPVELDSGISTIRVPAKLEEGNYKLYVYIIQNGDRQTAVIRDIRV